MTTTPHADALFRQARAAAREALRGRLEDERYLLGRELELLAVADRWGLTDEAISVDDVNTYGGTVTRLRTAVGLRRVRIARLEAELATPTPPTTEAAE